MNELTESKSTVMPWIGLAVSILYMLSPVDILPDVVPVVGWVDDAVIGLTGTLNFFQVQAENANSSLASLLKGLKWMIVILGGILVLLLLLEGLLLSVCLLNK